MKKKKNPKPTELHFSLFPHFASLILLVWGGSSSRGLCPGLPSGRRASPSLACGQGDKQWGCPLVLTSASTCPSALLLCPWTFRATWVAWFWQAAWQCEVTLLAWPIPTFTWHLHPACQGKILKDLLPLVPGSAPGSHPLLRCIPRPSPWWDVSQPWPKGDMWQLDWGRLISVGRGRRSCPKEHRPAVAGASPGWDAKGLSRVATSSKANKLESKPRNTSTSWNSASRSHSCPRSPSTCKAELIRTDSIAFVSLLRQWGGRRQGDVPGKARGPSCPCCPCLVPPLPIGLLTLHRQVRLGGVDGVCSCLQQEAWRDVCLRPLVLPCCCPDLIFSCV